MTNRDELETHFGSRVCAIVLEVSDDKSLDKSVRKAKQIEHAPHLSSDAQSLKLADKTLKRLRRCVQQTH